MKKHISAVVTTEIVLPNEFSSVIPIDTMILIDLEKNIAYWEGQHFDISPDEYKIIQDN